MSKVQVDKVVNLSDDGAPQLTYGAELPVGYGLTGAGGLNISGVVTAASAVFSGNVTIGGTLTYEDVTNIDVVGVSTFAGRMNVNSTLEANEGLNVTAGVSTFAGNLSIAQNIIHTGDTDTKIHFSSADQISLDTGGTTRVNITSGGNLEMPNDNDYIKIGAGGDLQLVHTGSASIIADSGAPLEIRSDTFKVASGVGTERLRINSSGQTLINTTSALDGAVMLGVKNPTSTDTVVDVVCGNTTAGSHIAFSDDAYARGIISYNHANNFLAFRTNGVATDRLHITSGGQVVIGATSVSPANSYSNNLVVSEASGDCGISIHGNNSNSNYASLYFGDAGAASRAYFESQLGSGGNFTIGNAGVTRFLNDGAERARITTNGRLLIGQTSADTDIGSQLQVAGTSYAASGVLQARVSGDIYGPALDFLKGRNTTWGSHTIVQSGDQLGRIYFRGDDGVNYAGAAALIMGEVDGTPGADDMPGRLTFHTSADDSDSLGERLRITSSGQLLVGTTSARTNFRNGATGNSATPQYQFETANDDALNDISLTYGRNNAYGAEIIFAKHRAATVGGTSAAQNNDRLGGISFNGSDGTNFQPAAFIEAEVDGTPGTDDMPGRLVFCTTADGEKVPTERVRIYQNGIPQITNAGESLFGTGVTAINIGNGVNVSMADDASFTASSACNTGALISVGTTKDSSGNIRYRHGLFFAQYGSTSVTEISDTENTFATSDSDGYVCVYATSSVNGNVVIKNRLGHTSNICVTIVRFLGN